MNFTVPQRLVLVAVCCCAACWVSIPSYYYEFGPTCYPHSSLSKNPYGDVIRRHFRVYPPSGSDIPADAMATAKTLVDLGVPVDEPAENGSTPLMWAGWAGFENLTTLFLEAGADVHATARNGTTALMCSALWGSRRTTELLLDGGADADARDADGNTPLLMAARRVDRDKIELLLGAGADVDAQNRVGMSALMLVASGPPHPIRTMTAALLIDGGADPSMRNMEGKTAAMLARDNENEELATLIEESP